MSELELVYQPNFVETDRGNRVHRGEYPFPYFLRGAASVQLVYGGRELSLLQRKLTGVLERNTCRKHVVASVYLHLKCFH